MMNESRPILRAAGSLWFAAVLLMLLLVAMACATVFESMHGAERALRTFYQSWWFETLLALLCVNLAAAVILRYPFPKRKIGFVLTHAAVIVTLGGAVISKHFAVDGQVSIAEGQTVGQFNDFAIHVLTGVNRSEQSEASLDLTSRVFGGYRTVDRPDAPALVLGDARISVKRYVPDSRWFRRVVEGDDQRLPPALEVSLSSTGQDAPLWMFADQPAQLGTIDAVFRVAADADELDRLLEREAPSGTPDSAGVVKVVYADQTFEIPLEDCTDKAVPLGDTGHTIRVLHYLPHAVVGAEGLNNASDRPVNPAIEVEIVGPTARETRVAFAKFPGFKHGAESIEQLELTFIAADDDTAAAPLEVLGAPDGELYVRFQPDQAPPTIMKLSAGAPVESPWHGLKFAVLGRLEHARVDWSVESIDPVRKERVEALLLELSTPEQTVDAWVRKGEPRRIALGDTLIEVMYGGKRLPLGFQLTLNRFRLGTYPGTNRPRSYESQVTTVDPATGRTQSHVASMNHPAEHGGYTLYQSSYRSQPGGKTISFLSVARDPGKPVVFAGYIAMMAGMLINLVTRMAKSRRLAVEQRAAHR